MTYRELLYKATRLINKNEITLGEYEEMTKPLDREVEQEPILDKINKMKFEIADSLEFWDYSPNNNPLAMDMLEIITKFWGDIKEESEEKDGKNN